MKRTLGIWICSPWWDAQADLCMLPFVIMYKSGLLYKSGLKNQNANLLHPWLEQKTDSILKRNNDLQNLQVEQFTSYIAFLCLSPNIQFRSVEW